MAAQRAASKFFDEEILLLDFFTYVSWKDSEIKFLSTGLLAADSKNENHPVILNRLWDF